MQENKTDISNLPMVDPETNRCVGESLKALKEGRFTIVDPINERQMNKLVGLSGKRKVYK